MSDGCWPRERAHDPAKPGLLWVSSGGVEYPGVHPPLVSADLWQQANSIRTERTIAGGRVGAARPGLLCRVRRKEWIYPSGPKQHRQRNYLCSGRSRRTCDAPYVHAEPIEAQMIALLGALQVTPDIETAVLSELQRLSRRRCLSRRWIERASRRASSAWGRLYKDEVITDEEYTIELVALRTQLAAAAAPPALDVDVQAAISRLHQFSSFVTSSSVEGLQAMLRAVFSHVWARAIK